jgi:hypothetical protein
VDLREGAVKSDATTPRAKKQKEKENPFDDSERRRRNTHNQGRQKKYT